MPRPKPPLPDPPRALASKQAAELSSHAEAALRRQRRELAQSLKAALDHIPWPLRGAVRRVLGL
jgi:hypothetical protein